MALEDYYRPQAIQPAAPNAVVLGVIAARPGFRVQIGWLAVSYSGVPAGGRIIAGNAGNPDLDLDVAGAGVTQVVNGDAPLTFEPGQAVTVAISAGGVGISGKISLGYKYVAQR